MKKSLVKNYIYNLFYQILTIIMPLITTPYLSRVLGAEKIGIYSYTLSITTYFILFGSLGIALYGQREIAYLQEKRFERSKCFWEIITVRFITLSISSLLFVFSFCLNGEYFVYYRILLLEILANCLDISFYFQGIEEFKKTVIRNSLIKILSVICVFLFVKCPNDLYEYIIIYVGANLFGNVSLWFGLTKYIDFVDIREIKLSKHFNETIKLFIPQIAVQIYTVLDKTMIGFLVTDKSEVGYYEQAQKIIRLLLAIVSSIGIVMVPRMSHSYAQGNHNKINEYMKNSISFVLFLAFPLMFGIISISYKFVPIFYGNNFEEVKLLIVLLSPILIFIGISNVIGSQYLLPTKQEGKYTFSVTCGAITNILLNLIFIKMFKAYGAAISTVIAELVVTTVQLFFVRQKIRLRDIWTLSHNFFISSIAMFIISLSISIAIHNNIVSIIVQIIVSIIVYISILAILKEKLILEGFQLLKNHKKN